MMCREGKKPKPRKSIKNEEEKKKGGLKNIKYYNVAMIPCQY
jgi:hypothetical protein